jgi:hypothetical protein
LEDSRAEAYRGLVVLLDRAKAAGRLRPDFVPEDLVILLMANAGVVAATGDAAPEAWRRHVAYQLQAFAVPGNDAGPALPPAPKAASVYRAMLRSTTVPPRAGRARPAPTSE